MGGRGVPPEAAGGTRPAASAHRAPEISLQGPLEIQALQSSHNSELLFCFVFLATLSVPEVA